MGNTFGGDSLNFNHKIIFQWGISPRNKHLKLQHRPLFPARVEDHFISGTKLVLERIDHSVPWNIPQTHLMWFYIGFDKHVVVVLKSVSFLPVFLCREGCCWSFTLQDTGMQGKPATRMQGGTKVPRNSSSSVSNSNAGDIQKSCTSDPVVHLERLYMWMPQRLVS